MGLQSTYRRDQLQPCTHGPFCVVLMGLWIPEVDEDPIAHVLRYEAAEALHGLGDALLVAADNLSQVFRVHAGREGRRAYQVRKHHCDLTTLGSVMRCNRCNVLSERFVCAFLAAL